MKISVYALLWCTYLCTFAGDIGILPADNEAPIGQPVNQPEAQTLIQELTPAENEVTTPELGIPANATADTLREAITLLNMNSGFNTEPTVGSPADQLLYDIFGEDNYIQLQNPQHAEAKELVKRLVEASPTIAPEHVLRAYLAQRGTPSTAGQPRPTPTPVPAPTDGAARPQPAPRPQPGKQPAPPAPTPGKPAPTPGKPAPTGQALDLKPITDATGKLNSALARIRNAKQVKVTGQQRAMLKKEAEKLLKENNSKLKLIAQRVNRIIAEPNFAGNPDKVAPFKRFAELYNAIEQEVLRP